MSNNSLRMGSLLSLPISLIIDWLVIWANLPDYHTIFTTISYFTSISINASPVATTTAFSNAMIGLLYFAVVYCITDAIIALLISSLKQMQRAVSG
ncbi:MAG: hypothetical protein QXT39_06230 [Conexivisphaerales archaeon]